MKLFKIMAALLLSAAIGFYIGGALVVISVRIVF